MTTPTTSDPNDASPNDASPNDASPASADPDRRQLLTGLGGAALAAAATVGVAGLVRGDAEGDGAATSGDGAPSTPTTTATGGGASSAPIPVGDVLDPAGPEETLLRRIRRATFGATAGLAAEVAEIGWDAWLDAQLDPGAIDDPEVDALVAGYSTLTMSPLERRELLQTGDEGKRRVGFELRHATLVRAVHSQRQLLEVLVDHWNNHFNVDVSEQPVALTKADEDAAFRAGALGPFHDLLVASASSPAMLLYLDNATSATPSPNENYGRELLELHTVGVDGGYDEADVVDAARVFTGWSLDRRSLEFVFRPAAHDTGPKAVLGWSTPGFSGAQGEEEGHSLLRHLADHPNTARHVTRRLAQRLVADVPPDHVVDAGVAAWEASDGRIADVVRAILDPAVFDGAVGPKVSRPFEALATMLRRLDATVPADLTDERRARPAFALHQPLNQLGQPLFRAPAPTGYPDVAPAWVSTNSVAARWQLAIRMVAAHAILGIDLERFRGDDVASTARNAAELLWLRSPSDGEVAALVEATGDGPTTPADDAAVGGLVALALATGVAHER